MGVAYKPAWSIRLEQLRKSILINRATEDGSPPQVLSLLGSSCFYADVCCSSSLTSNTINTTGILLHLCNSKTKKNRSWLLFDKKAIFWEVTLISINISSDMPLGLWLVRLWRHHNQLYKQINSTDYRMQYLIGTSNGLYLKSHISILYTHKLEQKSTFN